MHTCILTLIIDVNNSLGTLCLSLVVIVHYPQLSADVGLTTPHMSKIQFSQALHCGRGIHPIFHSNDVSAQDGHRKIYNDNFLTIGLEV